MLWTTPAGFSRRRGVLSAKQPRQSLLPRAVEQEQNQLLLTPFRDTLTPSPSPLEDGAFASLRSALWGTPAGFPTPLRLSRPKFVISFRCASRPTDSYGGDNPCGVFPKPFSGCGAPLHGSPHPSGFGRLCRPLLNDKSKKDSYRCPFCGDFALCGARPRAPPLEPARFLRKSGAKPF